MKSGPECSKQRCHHLPAFGSQQLMLQATFCHAAHAPLQGHASSTLSRVAADSKPCACCRSPEDPNVYVVKRLIALEGDWLMLPGETETITVPKASSSLSALATQPANGSLSCVAVAVCMARHF